MRLMPPAKYFRKGKQVEPARLNINVHPDLAAKVKRAARDLPGGISALISLVLEEKFAAVK